MSPASVPHPTGPDRSRRRGAPDRAATLVEYALVLAALVIALIAVLDAFETSSRDEVSNEFDCVSERPPPTTCQKRPITTTTASTISATTSTTLPAATTTPPSTTTTQEQP